MTFSYFLEIVFHYSQPNYLVFAVTVWRRVKS